MGPGGEESVPLACVLGIAWVKDFGDPKQSSLLAGSLSLALGDGWTESVGDTSVCRWVNDDVPKE